jgi:hypothetical protein
MSRILAIKGTDADREVDYSSLSLKDIRKKIKIMKESLAALVNSFAVMIASPARRTVMSY